MFSKPKRKNGTVVLKPKWVRKLKCLKNTVLYNTGEYGGIQLELYTQRFRPFSELSPRGFI